MQLPELKHDPFGPVTDVLSQQFAMYLAMRSIVPALPKRDMAAVEADAPRNDLHATAVQLTLSQTLAL